MANRYTKIIFWLLAAVFLALVGQFFVPSVNALLRGSVFLIPILIFSLLGFALVFVVKKLESKGKLRGFLLLTGISSGGFFVSIILYNFFYALGEAMSYSAAVNFTSEVLHALFFFAAIFICPLGFLIGMVGSVIMFYKK